MMLPDVWPRITTDRLRDSQVTTPSDYDGSYGRHVPRNDDPTPYTDAEVKAMRRWWKRTRSVESLYLCSEEEARAIKSEAALRAADARGRADYRRRTREKSA
jgi:hypothetical protein